MLSYECAVATHHDMTMFCGGASVDANGRKIAINQVIRYDGLNFKIASPMKEAHRKKLVRVWRREETN